jgi:hypothetical protein
MANPKLFKPFHHEPSKQVYFDGAPSHQNLNLIAHDEFKITWTGYGVAPDYPDIVLSIGTGLETESSRNSQDTDRISIISRVKGYASGKTQQKAARSQRPISADYDSAWNDYLDLQPISDPTRFVRLNSAFSDVLPAPDNIYHMKSLQNLQNGHQIKRLAAQLFATLFYFESLDIQETSDNQFIVQGKLFRACSSKLVQLILFLNLGHILCRLPDDTPEIREIGKYLSDCNVQNTHFTIQEQGCNTQRFKITARVVEDMVNSLRFRMAKIEIRLLKKLAVVEAVLCLKGGEYPISGFPRSLERDNSHTMSNMSRESM